MSTSSHNFSQQTCFIRSLKFRANKDNFWMQHVIGDTLLNMFCLWWWLVVVFLVGVFFGWLVGRFFWLFLLSKDNVKTIITSP